jgi:poly(3-hydroxybutyrate) depolymerase
MPLRKIERQAALWFATAMGLVACVTGIGGWREDAGYPGTSRTRDSGSNQSLDAGVVASARDSGVEDGGPDSGEIAPARDSGFDAGPDSGQISLARDSGVEDAAPDSGVIAPARDSGIEDGGPDSGVIAPARDGGLEATCKGKPGALRGKIQASVEVDRAMRTFVYYAPASLDANKPAPVVLLPHGYSMTGESAYTQSGFNEIADREKLVVIFPNGSGSHPWNAGPDISGFGSQFNNLAANDQGFIDAILEFAEADQCLDKRHIFIAGFSMGGYLSNETGCLRDDIAGLGPHSAGSHDLSQCPGTRKPVIIFHGGADYIIAYEDGVLTRDRWVARNGCRKDVDSRSVKGGTCDYNRGCPEHAQVALCHFDSMEHAWAGGRGILFADPTRESASELAWAFWKEFAW